METQRYLVPSSARRARRAGGSSGRRDRPWGARSRARARRQRRARREGARKLARGGRPGTVPACREADVKSSVARACDTAAAESDSVGLHGMSTRLRGASCSSKPRCVRRVRPAERSASPAALILTGQLGDVMKESARAALTYALRYATEHGSVLAAAPLEVHIHVPAGAIPKDGPSAGTAMATALISALTERPVRRSVAMTERSLCAEVLPIGGVNEKSRRAPRGITDVICPGQPSDSSTFPTRAQVLRYSSTPREVLASRPHAPADEPALSVP